MIEYELAKVGGAKMLGSAIFLPSFAILIVGGIIAWQLHENRKYAWEMQKIANSKQKEIFTNLKNNLDVLNAERHKLSFQITQLQDNFGKLDKMKASTKEDIPLGAFLNEASKPTKNSPKLAMLKKLVDDNVELRKII